ncbi:MAG: hypothetical protein K9M99_06080 [Candidatus Cloacimonetes bacterium]|nr:hypothetical protein [Candidatus Cloacimonadota bacterium]
MHRLSRNTPSEIAKNRFDWQDNRLYTSDIQDYLPDFVKDKISGISFKIIKLALKLMRDNSTYGLIHFDLHYDNFTILEKELCLYDFDN